MVTSIFPDRSSLHGGGQNYCGTRCEKPDGKLLEGNWKLTSEKVMWELKWGIVNWKLYQWETVN